MQVDQDSFNGGAEETGVEDDTSDVIPISDQCNNCLILNRKLERVEGENNQLKQAGPPGNNKLSLAVNEEVL